MFKDTKIFVKEMLGNSREVGTIASTSKYAARVLAPVIHKKDSPKVIVELGAGTGSVTEAIAKKIRPIDLFISIECNENLFDVCKRKLVDYSGQKNIILLCDIAQNLPNILKKHNVKYVDEIICTIPFRVLPKKDTAQILNIIKTVLKPGGLFSFIRYITAPKNKDVFEILDDSFETSSHKIIMRNIPPTAIIKMRKK